MPTLAINVKDTGDRIVVGNPFQSLQKPLPSPLSPHSPFPHQTPSRHLSKCPNGPLHVPALLLPLLPHINPILGIGRILIPPTTMLNASNHTTEDNGSRSRVTFTTIPLIHSRSNKVRCTEHGCSFMSSRSYMVIHKRFQYVPSLFNSVNLN
jgi:hypothetical protein